MTLDFQTVAATLIAGSSLAYLVREGLREWNKVSRPDAAGEPYCGSCCDCAILKLKAPEGRCAPVGSGKNVGA